MLSRILEPEVMDTAEEARDYDAMDHREVNQRFVDDLFEKLPPGRSAAPQVKEDMLEILDLGTGTAQIPIEICRRSREVKIVAVDAAAEMLAIARQNVEAAGLRQQIFLAWEDAKRLTFGDNTFNAVISNSIIHHLLEPRVGLQEAVRVTKKGGLLFFRDLLRPDSEGQLWRLVDQYAPAAGSFPGADHQRQMFADSLHAALSMDEVRGLIAELGFPSDTALPTSDRHWTWAASK